MSKKTLLILVVIIGVLAIAAFVLGLSGDLFDIDAGSFSKEHAIEGVALGPNSVQCEPQCASKCRTKGREVIVKMDHREKCRIQVDGSQADTGARKGAVAAIEGTTAIDDLEMEIQGNLMDMGRIELEPGEEKNLQFFEKGGRFSITCLSSDGCQVRFPAKTRN